jgi:thioredoxin
MRKGFWVVAVLLFLGNVECTAQTAAPLTGLTKATFEKLLDTNTLVLVDFYADWCGPCRMLKPVIDEIETEMADKVTVLRINTDKNPALCRELYINAIPITQVYKKGELQWTGEGYMEKKMIMKELK